MPKAQVLHAFLERNAFHIFRRPPASRPFLNVYQIAGQPPPDFGRRMIDSGCDVRNGLQKKPDHKRF